ncbi:MAG: hypothetical protein AAF004_02655 [Pseudomonadota bacterium]
MKACVWGGSPYFYNWYRWGYGWSFQRKYQALTPAEEETAQQLLANYRQSVPEQVCRSNESIETTATP